jgi:hypothetical protein
MKKLVIGLGLIAMTISSFAQVTIEKHVDEMTDKVSYFASERFVAANSGKSKGCAIDVNITEKNGVLETRNFIVQMVGLEKCNENNKLIFLFEDGSKITMDSWNKFNCKGTAYFSLSKQHLEELKTKVISKVRITNGRSFKSYTAEVTQKSYFIKFYNQLNK